MRPPSRQTLSYLQGLFAERGIRPKNKLGQNFLIDLNLIDLLVKEAELGPNDLVLEVGTGTGSLTRMLTEQAGGVLSVEIDADFFRLAEETLGYRPHMRLVHTDILKNKNQLSPEVMEQLRSGVEKMRRAGSVSDRSEAPRTSFFDKFSPRTSRGGRRRWRCTPVANAMPAAPGSPG